MPAGKLNDIYTSSNSLRDSTPPANARAIAFNAQPYAQVCFSLKGGGVWSCKKGLDSSGHEALGGTLATYSVGDGCAGPPPAAAGGVAGTFEPGVFR